MEGHNKTEMMDNTNGAVVALLFVMLTIVSLSCNEDKVNPFSAYVDGYSHVSISSESLQVEYLFTHTEPSQNVLYAITDDSVSIQLNFYEDSLDLKKLFKIKFHFHRVKETISQVSLFVNESYPKNGNTTFSIGEYVPTSSGFIERFVPVNLKVSDVRYSAENRQISFDYATRVNGVDNSSNTTLQLEGSLRAKHRP